LDELVEADGTETPVPTFVSPALCDTPELAQACRKLTMTITVA